MDSDVIVTDPRFPRMCDLEDCERVLSNHLSESAHRARDHGVYERRGKPLFQKLTDNTRYFRCNNCHARIKHSKKLRKGGTRCHSCGRNPSTDYGSGNAQNIH